jgi:ABC-type nitrate/sulfonate/bicarbonate transport system substrate-binding protein
VQLNTSKDSGEVFGTTGTERSAGTTGTIGTVSSERSDSELLRQLARVVGSVLLCIAFSGASAFAQQTTKVRMAYSAFSISFLNIFLARDASLFKKHGIDVELIQMAGPLPIAALSAGEIDYLTGYTTGLVATGQGIPLKGIMVALRRPPFYVVAEPNIKSLSDLGGKRVGVDRIGSLQHLVTRLLFKNKAVDPEKVIFTQTGSVSNTVTSLGQGAVSAALLSGPHNVIMTQKGFRQVAAADELPMSFPTSGLVVHEAKLKADANRIKAVIRAMLDSVAFSHKERAWVVNYVRDKWKAGAEDRRNRIRAMAFYTDSGWQNKSQRLAGLFRFGLRR